LKALRSPEFFPEGVRLGFACSHLYEDSDLPDEENGLPPKSKASTLKLKGADALFAVAASSLGLEVTALRIVAIPDLDETEWVVSEVPSPDVVKRFGRVGWGDGQVERLIDDAGIENTLGARHLELNEIEWIRSMEFGKVTSEGPASARFATDFMYNPEGYFGNEASDVTFYTSAALVVDVPEADDEFRVNLMKEKVETFDLDAVRGLKRPRESKVEEVRSFERQFDDIPVHTGYEEQLEVLSLADLKKKARSLKVSQAGSKEELIPRIAMAIVEKEARRMEEIETKRFEMWEQGGFDEDYSF
jgi:hypothetical protein